MSESDSPTNPLDSDPESKPGSAEIDLFPPASSPQYDWTQPPVPRSDVPLSSPAPTGGALIPTANPYALFSYYCGVFALIPCLGLILGPMGIILGSLGLRAIEKSPELPGKVHAWVGIVLSGLVLLGHAILIGVILSARG